LTSERVVGLVGYDGAELLDIACVTSTFALANLIGSLAAPYRVVLLSSGGRAISCDSGLVLSKASALETFRGPIDTLVVSGGLGHVDAAANAVLVAHVRRLSRESRRVASVCTGATVLAAAGLLDGRRATTHWRYAGQLARSHPSVTVDADPIFIRDGRVSTSGGVTSSLDLALAFIAEDHGGALARQVSRDLVTYLQRPGNQAQLSLFTAAPAPSQQPVRRVVDHVAAHPAGDLSTSALAAVAGVSAGSVPGRCCSPWGRSWSCWAWRTARCAGRGCCARKRLPAWCS
jgi:transcriptional regulator GlxA family with amidase domain